MKTISINPKSFLFFIGILIISLTITSCDDKCDELAKEYNAFTVKIRPSFSVMKEDEGGETYSMINLGLVYHVFKMHCEGFQGDIFMETGHTSSSGIFEINQSFTCEISTPDDYVVIRIFDLGSEDAFYEKKLFPEELREAQGFYGKQLHVDYYGVW